MVNSSTGRVPAGTPVVARFNPSNGIVTAVRNSAQKVGLGPVSAPGFKPDCSPQQNTVIVCRNPTFTHGEWETASTPTTCVVQLDPRLGNGSRSDRVTAALQGCL